MKKLLLIDDDVNFKEAIRLLTEGKCEFYYVSSPFKAYKECSVIQPDIILLDLNFSIPTSEPDSEGLEIYKNLRKIIDYQKIIIVSGFITREILKEFSKLGIEKYLHKPFDIKDFYQMINI